MLGLKSKSGIVHYIEKRGGRVSNCCQNYIQREWLSRRWQKQKAVEVEFSILNTLIISSIFAHYFLEENTTNIPNAFHKKRRLLHARL